MSAKSPVIGAIRSFHDVESALNNFRSYLAQVGVILDKTSADGFYAPAGSGVTNGDDHDHVGGDGATINHATLGNLAVGDPHTQYQQESEKGQVDGYASLDENALVVENPANATATPTASKIPIADGAGDLSAGWVPEQLGSHKFGSASHHTQFEADGTMKAVGDATTFNDINISGNSLGVGPAAPSVVAIAGSGILSYAFIGTGVLSDELHGSMEILHDYKEGSNIAPHVHWMPSTADVGDVKWQMEYIWVNRGGTAGASTTIDVTTAAGGTAWVGHISSFPAVSGAGMEMGSRFMFRIFRNPADGADTYGFDAVLLDIGVHYERDTVGSRTVAAK
jgi:hypothetical protein